MSASGDQNRFSCMDFRWETESELHPTVGRAGPSHLMGLVETKLGNLSTLSDGCARLRVDRKYMFEAGQTISAASVTATPILVAGEIELEHHVTAVFRLE